MNNNKQNIEDLFKDNLKDYSAIPNKNVWVKLSRKLSLKRFMKFNTTTFNIYYVILVGLISTIAIYNISPKNKKDIVKQNTPQQHKTIITDNKINNKKENIIIEENTNNLISKKEKNNSHLKTNKQENKEKTTQTNSLTTNNIVKEEIAKENAYFNVEENNISKLAKPSAEFSASAYEACEPATIVFTNTSENCDKFLWNFGNEATSKIANPTFVFKTAGKYTVKLTVYSGSITSEITKEIVVLEKPKADFIILDKNEIFKNDEVKFANTSTNFTSSLWNFGDETTSNFTHPSHEYENSGFYDVSLICFSKDNCSDTSIIKSIQIKDEKYKIYAPTALSPDLNGASSGYLQKGTYSKSVFCPIFNTEPSLYYLRIYNKFGSIIFESRDANFGWNGYYNNKPAPLDVYIWECSGKYADGKNFSKTGNLTIVYLNNQ